MALNASLTNSDEELSQPTKIYLVIDYEDNRIAKENGCKWDATAKKWYTLDNECKLIDEYKLVYLNGKNLFKEKDEIKKLGGKWDSSIKKWYTFKGNQDLKRYV